MSNTLAHFFIGGIEYYYSKGKHYKDNGTVRTVLTKKQFDSALINKYASHNI